MALLLPLLAFLCVSLLVMGTAMMFAPGPARAIEERLSEVSEAHVQPAEEEPGQERLLSAFKRLGSVAPRPIAEMGKLQQRLVTAGYRGREALVVFLGIRVGVALLAFMALATPIFRRPSLALALAAGGVGYVLSGMVLARVAKRRQHRIRLGLADALDLLVVSVEAGLGLDQALQRVSDELAFVYPDLCEELKLVNLELRAGQARIDALHNLATRTAIDDVSSLVTMLVQTDKFGTSVAQSLRVHSDTLRTKRRQRAEEAAAKTGAKMVFPLVICVFPAIWVVTLGPAVIKFVQVLLPMSQK